MNLDDDTKRTKSRHDLNHRVLRYVLKMGDLEEAVHVFVDLLGMHVLNHLEYDDGSPDGAEVHYEGQWSRTLVGYGKTEDDQICLQLTLNHGVAKYSRGNHFHAIEIQLGSTSQLEGVGLKRGFSRGKPAFLIDCNGYNIEVVKSDDGKNRISCVILNCDEPISLSGPTVRFWTYCLGFEIVCWSTDPDNDSAHLIEYTNVARCNLCCCFLTRVIKKKSIFKPLLEGELSYVELQYGSTSDFYIRLQSLPPGVPIDTGTGKEVFILTGSAETLSEISKKIQHTAKRIGGTQNKKRFTLVPGRDELFGVVAKDLSGIEVCYYEFEHVKLIHERQLDAEQLLRQSIKKNNQRMQDKLNSRRKSVRLQI